MLFIVCLHFSVVKDDETFQLYQKNFSTDGGWGGGGREEKSFG